MYCLPSLSALACRHPSCKPHPPCTPSPHPSPHILFIHSPLTHHRPRLIFAKQVATTLRTRCSPTAAGCASTTHMWTSCRSSWCCQRGPTCCSTSGRTEALSAVLAVGAVRDALPAVLLAGALWPYLRPSLLSYQLMRQTLFAIL